ncbi:putative Ig domain-containing protein [Hymenobacter sp. BT730]|uniref:putative Ig domain-containing protein n=1 Tax=Hymenobacter sp. BT730 TaxID=3063332 RepID=UPI0026E0D996|nr:putative Ig domain-containing protein [Hymenobacter sp. BT730]
MKILLHSVLLLLALVPLGVQGQARKRDSITDIDPSISTAQSTTARKSLKRQTTPVAMAVAATCINTTTLNFATRTTNEDWKNHAPVNAGGGSTNTTISTAGSYVEPAGGTQTGLYVTPVNGANSLYWEADYTSTADVTTQITYSLNRPVNNFSLRIQDIDLGAQAWVDKVTFTATQADGTVLNLSSTTDATVTRDAAYISLSGNSLQGLQNVAANSTLGNVTVTFNKPIVSFKITYQNVITGIADPLGQYIAIDYMSWCTQANVATTLSGTNHAKAGSTVTYTATTTASGDYAATGVQPKVQFTPGTVLASYPTGSTYVQSTGVLTLPTIANLAIGASSTSVITFVMPATTVNGTASSTIGTDDADPLDNNGSAAAAKVTTVVNTPPVPTALSSTTPRAVYTQLSPLAATDVNGDAISTFTITQASLTALNTSGKLYVKSGSTYTEVNAGNFSGLVLSAAQAASLYFLPNSTASVGTVSFSYYATDSQGDISTSTAAYSLNITNSAPVAATTTYSGATIYSTDGQKAITALQASDADGTIATYQIASLPTDGTLFYNTNADGISGTYVAVASANLNTLNLSPAQAASLRFDPSGLASGNVIFTFTAKDNNGQVSNTATYTIPVASSIVPVAANTTNSGTILSSAGQTTISSLQASDADGAIATYQIASLPADGTLYYNNNVDGVSGTYVAFTSGNIGTVTLTPAQAASLKFDPSGAFNGNVAFTFTAKDNVGNLSNVATYTVPVSNVAPVAADVTMTTAQPIPGANGPTAIPALTATDTDGTVASYQISALPGSGTLSYNTAADGTSGTYVAITSAMLTGGASQLNLTAQQAASLKYDPSGATNSNVTFTYTATDNNGAVDATPATFTITLGNQAPRAISGTNSSVTTTTKNDAYRLNWTAPNGTLNGSDADGTIASFTITGGLPNTTTQGELTYSTTDLGVNVGRNNNALTIITTSTVIPAGAYLYFNPAANTTATTLALQFTAKDNSGLASANTATYTVPVNQNITEPIASNVSSGPIVSSASATAITAFSGSLNGNTSLYSYIIRTIPNGDTQGTLYVNGVAVTTPEFELLAADANKLTFDPSGASNTTVTFTYTVRANSATGPVDTTPATYTITLSNAAPVATAVSNSLSSPIASSAGQTAISSLNATDADGSITSYSIKSLPTDGTLYYNNNTDGVSGTYVAFTSGNIGTVTLTPAQAAKLNFDPSGAFGGTVTFTYAATDNQSAVSNTATYSIQVTDVDKEAVYTVAAAKNVDSYTTGNSLATVTDADGALASAVLATGSTLPAGVALNATTGQFTVSNASLLVAGSYPLSVATTDVLGGVTTQSITLTFTADKEAVYTVVAAKNADDYTTGASLATVADADGALTSAVLANGTSLPAGVALNATTGQLTVSNASLLVAGSYTFQVKTTDVNGGTTTQAVTLTFTADKEAVYTVAAAKNVDSYPVGASLATVNDADGALTAAVLAGGSTLPAGVALNATTGQFTVSNAALLVAGTYALSVTTTDALGGTTTQSITLTFTADKEAVYSVAAAKNVDSYTAGASLATVTDVDGTLTAAVLANGSTLPAGVALNATTGQFTVSSASALVAGSYPLTINTTDANGGKSASTITLTFTADREAVYSSPNTYNQDVLSNGLSLATVTDVDGALTTAALATGTLPTGMSFNLSTGQFTVSNSATLAAGTYSFTVNTVDASGGKSTVPVSITIAADKEAVYSLATAKNLDAYTTGNSLATVADADGAIVSATPNGTLPAGVSLNATTGQLLVSDAAALVAGTYTFQVATTDAVGGSTTQSITLNFSDAEAVYTVAAAKNVKSYANNQSLATVTDANGAITSAVLANGTSLPAGVALNATTGQLTVSNASLLVAGTYAFQVTTTDATGGITTQAVTLTFTGDAEAVYSSSNTYNQDALSNGMSLATVTDTNGGVVQATLTTGTLPTGMSFNLTTGQFTASNATLTAGTYSFRVNTVDATGGKSTNTVDITITTDAEATYSVGNTYAKSNLRNGQTLASVTDADATLTSATLAAGSSLPMWMQLNTSTGAITIPVATNAAAGVFTATINTVDAVGGKSVTTVSITVTVPPLPIELTTFNVQAVQANAQLTWRTAVEKNNDHFAVERSFDGLTFTSIGQVRGNGSTTNYHDYTFTDANVGLSYTGTVYYRLRQVDMDGKEHITQIRTVRFKATASAASISLFPNPAVDNTTLDLSKLPAGTYQVQVLDMTGRIVRQASAQGGLQQALDIRSLSEGTYHILIHGNSLNLNQKLVKRN